MEDLNNLALEDDNKSEAVQDEMFSLAKQVRTLIETNPDHMTPAAGIEMVRLAVYMLNAVESIDGLPEIIHPEDIDFKASVWGQILMSTTKLDYMTVEHKSWLLAVASHMGSDWIEAIRQDVAFMAKVESF